MMRFTAMLLVPSLVLIAGNPPKKTVRRGGPVNTAKEAKAIAEQETGGTAVTAKRVHLNGASGGWEVEVYMPKENRGWRCIIDADTHGIYTKDRIANPKPGKNHR